MPTSEKTFQQERYRIIHQLEQNENFAVYEAFDNVLQINVVLKELKNSSKNLSNITRNQTSDFSDEGNLLTALNHEHLLSARDYFSETDNHYLVMELIDDKNLVEWIQNNKKPFSFLEVAKWADQLLDTLNYLHKYTPPIIHQHISPQSVILSSNGKVNLFFSGDDETFTSVSDGKIVIQSTESNIFNYLPLEQIWEGLDPASQNVILNSYDERAIKTLEKPADARSDIYALGATLYYALTGQHPVDALARSIDLLDNNPDPLPAPHKLNPAIPQEISNVLLRALEIRRENRFDSAVIMRQILRTAFVKTNPVESTKTAAPTEQKSAALPQEMSFAEREKLERERQLIEQNRQKVEAEQRRLEEERLLIEQKKIELEAAQKQQAELANEQLRQAEARRIEAENRAAEAERLLREKTKKSVDDDLFEPADSKILEMNPGKSASPVLDNPKPTSEAQPDIKPPLVLVKEEIAASRNESSENLFDETQKSNKSFKLFAAVAVVLLILGGAGWGIWSGVLSKSVANKESVTNQSPISNEALTPKSSSESVTSPTAETNAQPSEEALTSAPSPENLTTINNSPALRNKTALPQSKKQISQPVKSAASQKKAVTVDDLINDN